MRRIALLPILALCACSSAGRSEPAGVQTVRVVDSTGSTIQLATSPRDRSVVAMVPMSADHVWRVLPAVYDGLGLEVSERDSATRRIGNAGFRVRRQLGGVRLSRYLDCGRAQDGPSAESYEVQLSVLTHVQSAEAGTTRVQTTVRATARPVNFSSSAVQCTSTGELEGQIAERIRAQGES